MSQKSTKTKKCNLTESYVLLVNGGNRHGRDITSLPIISLPVWIFIATLMICPPCGALEPPHVTPTNVPVVLKGQPLRLTCQGDKPLIWKPENTRLNDSRLSISNSTGDSSPRYTSNLILVDIKHTDAGFYTCSYEGTDVSNSEDEINNSKTVLVYVQDEDHLLRKEPTTFVHTKTGQDVHLFCVAAWPEVQIQIINDTSQERINLTKTNYSVEKGLKIHDPTHYDQGQYTCKATFQEKEASKTFTLVVIDIPSPGVYIFYPTIKVNTSIGAGEDFRVRCYTEQSLGVHFSLLPEGPPSLQDPDVKKQRTSLTQGFGQELGNRRSYWAELLVKDARKEDSGNYSCTVLPAKNLGESKTRFKEVNVFYLNETFLEVAVAVNNISVSKEQTAKWIINITSFPTNYNYSWRKPKGELIKFGTGKYKIAGTSKQGEFTLEIHDVTLEDMGLHPFKVEIPGTDVEPRVLNLHLLVKASPKVTIEPGGVRKEVNCKSGETCILKCTADAYPPAVIEWTFQQCNSSSSCEPLLTANATEIRKENDYRRTSVVEFNPIRHAKYICSARNAFKNVSTSTKIRVVDPDFTGNDDIAIMVDPEEVVDGDDVKLICALSKLDNANQTAYLFQVYGDSNKLIDSVKTTETQWSQRNILEIKNVTKSATGTYKCSTSENQPGAMKHLDVLSVLQPQMDATTNLNNSKVDLKLGDTLDLNCSAIGRPKPDISWTWDDQEIRDWPNDLKYELLQENQLLRLNYVPKDAQGRFQCNAQNRIGLTSAYVDIYVTGTRTFSTIAVCIIVLLFVFVVFFGGILVRYKYKQGEMNRFLKEIKQQDFYKGAVENINPDLSVTDQAALLPYDSAWEFPKDRLKLGMQLGSGAFGRVVKAEALGIIDTEPKTTVAVKMVKPNADESHFRALMSELKIMVHLGRHVNVVNLLGACTKDLAKKKELFVIVEYCKYGSLLSYLHRNKRTFINQLDPAKGIIDPNIYRPVNRNSEMSQAQRIHYAQLTFTDTGNSRKPTSNGYRTLEEFKETNPEASHGSVAQAMEIGSERLEGGYLTPNRNSTEHYVSESQAESACTGISYLSNGNTMTTDGTTKRRSSLGSQWQDHYKGDYQARDVEPIKTTDLLCWAFQIARGMEYLVQRKVLHGDLAARNVLLAENNIVKICDFGLAKEMYKGYEYKKKSEGVLLPVKWMAIESIYFGLFSSQSDCWSFGVVLWELFTLGKTPYPGMDADERFYTRISEGYRMEKPPLAPSCVYDIMLECWAQEPTERPSFSALVDRIGDMMTEGLRNHYIDLNAEYMRINHTYMSGRTDYLSQIWANGGTEFGPGSQRATPERRYQNVLEECPSGYLMPIVPSSLSAGPISPSPSVPQYQNISTREPTVVAVNNGYQFINQPTNTTAEVHEQCDLTESEGAQRPQLSVHINCSPDLKVMYGLREDSTSPDSNSVIDMPVDDKHVNIMMGNDGIRGIDNMNYVPNHVLFSKLRKTAPQTEPTKSTNGTNIVENNRRQNRQKNDSGLGSIDSTHFDQHKCNSQDGQHCSEFGHLQDTNGYVTHQNITTLS